METTDFCSFELSKKLKDCGFNEPCDHYYCEFDGGKDICFWGITPPQSQNNIRHQFENKTIADAPTLYHAQKWLREEKHLCVTVYAQPYNGVPYYTGYILFNGEETEVLDNDGHWFDKYEEALSAGIDAGLELLGKEVEK